MIFNKKTETGRGRTKEIAVFMHFYAFLMPFPVTIRMRKICDEKFDGFHHLKAFLKNIFLFFKIILFDEY